MSELELVMLTTGMGEMFQTEIRTPRGGERPVRTADRQECPPGGAAPRRTW